MVGTQIHHVRSGGIKIICFQTGISWREPQPDDRAGWVWTRCFGKFSIRPWRCFEGSSVSMTVSSSIGYEVLWTRLGWMSLWYMRQSPFCCGNRRENLRARSSWRLSHFSLCVQVPDACLSTAEPRSLPAICGCCLNANNNRCFFTGFILSSWNYSHG